MKNKTVGEMEIFFLALADKTRLRLLNLMREREVNVNAFVEILGESQPKISRHLAFLRKAGIVELRREGKWIHYRIAEPKNDFARLVLEDALRWLDSDDGARGESEEFTLSRGLSQKTETTKPLPQANISAKAYIKEKNELEIYLL